LREQLFLRLGELLGLFFKLAGLFLGLPEEFLRAEIALNDFQTHRDDRQQLCEQRLLVGVERAEGSEFQNRQQGVLGHQWPRAGVERRGPTQARGNLEIIRRQAR
jgi:hypothetical protein